MCSLNRKVEVRLVSAGKRGISWIQYPTFLKFLRAFLVSLVQHRTSPNVAERHCSDDLQRRSKIPMDAVGSATFTPYPLCVA